MSRAARHQNPNNVEIHVQRNQQRDPVPARSVTHPSKSLFKPADGFVWVSSAATDIRKTFARVRAQGVAA